jgi:glycosyltransferase involved in cell wall biosynthesis
MKLIYITSSLPYGPGESFLIPEVQELRARGHEVAVVPLYPRGRIVHKEAQSLYDPRFCKPLMSWEILLTAIRTFRGAPLHSLKALGMLFTSNPKHFAKNLIAYLKGLWLAEVARKWGADHMHAHWAATTASMTMVASEVSGIPWSLTAHRWDVVENNLLKRKALHARFFRCISQKTLEMARERGVPQDRLLVLHLGVRLPNGVASKKVGNAEGFVVLCPGALTARKGHKYLIEAMLHLPSDVKLWLAGEGELRPVLEEQVKELGLGERVRFLGHLPHEKLLNLYQQSKVNVVVLPSVDLGGGFNEGIPVALMEAMAFGIPVVSTQTGGIPELLGGEAGLLVPPGDAKALAEAIRRLYQDVRFAQRLGMAGQRRVREEFAVEEVAKRLEELFADKPRLGR